MATYKDNTGRWRYRWQERQDDGSLLKVTGTPKVNTRVGAEEDERQAIAKKRAERNAKPLATTSASKAVPTFADFAASFMATYAATNNKPSERAAKESILRLHLLPAIGAKPLDAIVTADVEALKAKLLVSKQNPDGVTAKRVNNILHVLSKILSYALELEILDRVPRMKALKVAPQRFDFLTFEELDSLVAASSSEPMWHAAILLGAEAGLRLGELKALRWEDVDLKRGQLVVMQANWHGHVGAPKGGRSRIVPLADRLLAALKGARHLRGPLVLCREDGTPLSDTNFRAAMKRIRKAAGLRHLGWHALRHTFCSHLAMKGASGKEIQDLAGHESIAVTNRYMHLAPGALRSAIDRLNARTA